MLAESETTVTTSGDSIAFEFGRTTNEPTWEQAMEAATITPTWEQATEAATITPTWEQAHEALVGMAKQRAGLDFEEGKWLLAAMKARVDRRLGYGSFVEYVERLFGYAPRLTQEKLRVAEALEELPELSAALEKGETSWSSVRELTRVSTPETEGKWLDAARGRTVREVERLVSGRIRGSLPTDPADDAKRRHVLRFEVTGEVLATFRDAVAKLGRDAGGALSDDDALLLMARHVLGGPVDDGRASYQLELSVCEDCRRARQRGHGELVAVTPDVAEMASCDAQHLPSDIGSGAKPRAKQAIPPALRRAVLRRDERRCRVPGCQHSTFLDLHHIVAREQGGLHEADNLVTLCGAHHGAMHRGELRVEGRMSVGLRFNHADGTDYGNATEVAPKVIDAQTKAFQALRQLGFGEREARRALSEVLAEEGPEASVETTLRAALAKLAAGAFQRASRG